MKNKLINYLRFNNDEPSSILQFLKNVTPSFNFSENIFSWEEQQKNSDLVNTIGTKTIKVLKTNNQEATLQAIYKVNSQAEDLVFTYKLTGLNATEWKLSYNEIAIIYAERKVNVNNQSKFNNLGEFTIGQYTNWLYSINLWEQPQLLEKAIYNLLNFSLTGIDFSS